MKLLWTASSKESYELLKTDAPELAEKVKSLLKDTVLHPDQGAGAPIKLEREYSGLWQRTYAPGQVIVYSVHEDAVTIVSIGAKETALQTVNLESYTKEDEQSVMGQMAANRGKDGEPKVGIFWYNRATT
jgi:Txe/YoeB family toxin of Txe-Axe toxin-antitoxin module